MPGVLGPGDSWNGGGVTGTNPFGGGWNPAYSSAAAPETGTLQILLGEGRMEGLVDGLKSIYLDGTPIQNSDLSMNFKGVAVALVAGTNTQVAVKGLTGTEAETAVGVQITQASPVTRTITSNPSAIRVRVAVPALKIINTTDGNSSGNTVTIKIERQNANWNGGAWDEIPLVFGGEILGGPFATKFTRSYRVDLPIKGSWQVRVTRVTADDADVYHLSQTWWEAYTELVDARLRYPNSAVLSLRVDAKQFKSIPRVTVDMKMTRVLVPANYDPATRTYHTTGFGTSAGAWDGTFGNRATSTLDEEVWTDNPAWVFYDAASKMRYGAGAFIDATALDKWTLYSIAKWCDTLVPDGKGGTEPRMVCNLYMQAAQGAIKALASLASIFWGAVFYGAGLITPVADSDSDPTALFHNANVKGGRFIYEGTARTARHTAALVSFLNPDLGWQNDVAVYEDTAGIARFGYNPLDLQGLGCTSQGQALRLGKWAILTELLASESVSFTAGLEGSTVRPGDVIQVADQFRAGQARFGGRCLAGSTTTSVVLDAPVTLGAGAYTLRIKNTAGVVESRTLTNGPGATTVLTFASPLSEVPAAGQGWLVQAGSTAALYRVIGVRADGLEYSITALLHDPSKYALLGLSATDVIGRNGVTLTTPAPSVPTLTAVARILDDRRWQALEAAWTLDGADSYIAEASRDYGPWQPMQVNGPGAVLGGVDPGEWRVRVAGVYKNGVSPASEASITITQPTDKPAITADLTTRTGPLNRIGNSSFYQSLAPWGVSGTTVPTYSGQTRTAGSGSAEQTATVTGVGTATTTGSVYQPFSSPPLQAGQTVDLDFYSGFRTYTANQNYSGYVKAYLFDCATAVETLLGTWNYNLVASNQSLAFTHRTVDITSYLANGGDFVLRFELQASTTNSAAGSIYSVVSIDEVKVVA